MIIYIIKNNRVETYTLPLDISGNYWISDFDDNSRKRNLINIEEKNGRWTITANYEFDLHINGEIVEQADVLIDAFYFLTSHNNEELISIFVTKIDNNYSYYQLNDNSEITIGKAQNCQVIYNNGLIADHHATLSYSNSKWFIKNLSNAYKTYVNGFPINQASIAHGSIIFIMGLKIIPIGNMLIITNPANGVICNLMPKDMSILDNISLEEIEDDDPNVTVYKKGDYFNRAPRFRSKIETLKMKLDAPPEKKEPDDMPVVLTVGPMITMSMVSVVMLYNGINNAIVNNRGINSAIPTIVMAVAMIGTMLIWPLITKKYNKYKMKKNEIKRREKYELYVQKKRQKIMASIATQRQILNENFISLQECSDIIINRKSKLWERKLEDNDFLSVRLGLGPVPLDVDISYPEEKFSLEEDVLKDIIKDFVAEAKEITGAPISVSLLEKRITGVVGNLDLTSNFMLGLLLQLVTFYTADILKIVILTNEENAQIWQPFKILQHCWNNEKSIRFFGSTIDEIKEINIYLDKELQSRMAVVDELKEETDVYKSFGTYYFIITDDYNSISDYNFIKKILKAKINYGFSLLIASEKLSSLPNECNCFININEVSSGLIENELVSTKQKEFIADMPNNIDIDTCCLILANIPINIDSKQKGLPDSYGFLEMYDIGRVEQLNALTRWKNNDPTISLSTPIGIDESGELFKLDLHEKFHGPHGLVAGTTGSGKSEWIITFILSMAINYHPYEVSFVIIDYKGGGLALAFENKSLGIKLPHIVGTITNLDVTEMNRSLASINAELKRRQKEFNIARDISGESTIDIYKYQRLYREGVVKKPISHLFIISDEFAELKAQQPEFMDQLISTARIGRSLGVHLILATQKPSGVVNDQIWSNSRFKVCLKVQDKADSKDMIMVPDAAEIKQAGRFYLLVGYNDYFALGQSAYCGLPYIPSDKIRKKIDTSLEFVNNVGYVIKRIDDIVKNSNQDAQGEVLLNVVKYLTDVAVKENVQMTPLWLERIPNIIYVDDLVKKYNFQKEDYNINPVIGEYDSPSTQSQHLLTLPLTKEGNTLIYGIPGSGKEQFLSSLVYSSITSYTSEEVNFYIIDCGAETLKMFSNAPQIGDVLFAIDKDKIIRLMAILNKTIEDRKKLFAEYGGTFDLYNKYTNDKRLPLIVTIINNYETFKENYENLEDNLTKITREGFRYGIVFIITASNTNAVKFNIKSNFSQFFALQLNDPYDYVTILGNVNKMVPSNNKGRGLIKLDNPYEFQTASIYKEAEEMEYVKSVCEKLKATATNIAPSIPDLPKVVNVDYVLKNIKTLKSVPIGVYKKSLKLATYDFDNNYINLISANPITNTNYFINGLLEIFTKINNVQLIVCDTMKLIEKNNLNINYNDTNFNDVLKKLILIENNIIETYKNNNYNHDSLKDFPLIIVLVIGLDNLFTSVEKQVKDDFTKSIKEGKITNKIKFILIDNPEGIKKYQYEDWFTANVKNNNGVWIGTGITNQSTIRLSITNRELNARITNDFGYIVSEGIPELIKLVQSEDKTSQNIETLEEEQ